jgi:flavin reductase (DIM6/NTAB) family NADH-FMN oxidoreductase RutF
MHYDARKNDHGLPHDPFKAIVAPRPIGWIGSQNKCGQKNLAPYSYFNGVSDRPHYVIFSSNGLKDSLVNIEETGVFTASLATAKLFNQMNISSVPAKYGIDEFELSGLTARRGNYVDAPCVAESPAVLECELWKVVDLPHSSRKNNSGNYIVIGHVIGIYIDDSYIKDGLFDFRLAEPLCRLGYMDYGIINSKNTFTKNRPKLSKDGKVEPVKDWDGAYK